MMAKFFFNSLSRTSAALNQLQTAISRALRWCSVIMVVLVCIVIFGRLFNVGSTALQESISYLHGFMFMLCMAYTAHVDGHVRVDIFYRRFSPIQKSWVNLLGTCLFLLPFALFLTAISWHSSYQSWQIKEGSINPGGLPLVYLLKLLPTATGILLLLHAIGDIFAKLVDVSTINHRTLPIGREDQHNNN